MLTDLFIKNLTLIESLELKFSSGLTVLTGETGAGKSILLDALLLIMGERASIEQIRDGYDELEVVAQFSFNHQNLIVRKIVSRHGRHKQLINGTPVTLTQLRETIGPLIDLTGQHAGHALLQTRGQLALLDAFANHENLLNAMSDAYEQLNLIKQKCAALSMDERTRLTRIDWLQFQLDEIETISPRQNELEDIKRERDHLAHAAKLQAETKRALEFLTESEHDADACSKVQQAALALQKGAQYSEPLKELSKTLLDAASLIDDVIREIQRYTLKLESNPQKLSQLEDRLFELQRLVRKHGTSIDDVLTAKKQMSDELAQLECMTDSLESCELELKIAQERCAQVATELTSSRQNAAEKFAVAVRRELGDLGMPEVYFKVELTPHELSILGADQITLMFSANPGESAHSLEKIASGGELSRVMLAIKHVLLTRDLTLVSIFDEVDAGVGGAMGEAIGEKLQKIAQGRQVLCITHLAQVASKANAHMKVQKHVVNGRTVTNVVLLSKDDRIEELARMMGGRHLTETTRKHAKEFLELAQA